MTPDRPHVLWSPPDDVRASTVVGRYLSWLSEVRGLNFASYEDLWRWSVDDLSGFWSSVWSFFDVRSSRPYDFVVSETTMPGNIWFPGARLNYAERALATTGDGIAVVARSQSREDRQFSWDQLRQLVGRCRKGLARLGVGRGDRVVAYLPNGPEALVAFLATASLGAVWASCPPEFGSRSVIDRFAQLDPVVLVATRGYRYGNKVVDRADEVSAILQALPTVRAVIDVEHDWDELLAEPAEPVFEQVPFDHPLYVLFSSGTTGPPKAIIHGHGGILLEHLKALGLHHDLGPPDRFFWFSTTGWMMWNYLISGLLVGSGIVLFDGDPGSPDLLTLWRLAAETEVTVLGLSAPFLDACRRDGLEPGVALDLRRVRAIGSTGAPLSEAAAIWASGATGSTVQISSISGGTDVCTAFVGPSPVLPVRAGEMSCRMLGANVEAWDEHDQPVIDREGELVVTVPMPSMPVGLWGDESGERLAASYYDQHPGVWTHGDWITLHADGSCVITGRSDATLNRGGVRLGTSEIYEVLDDLPEVADSLVVHLEDGDQLFLFVVMREGTVFSDGVRDRIRQTLRTSLSPRHSPDRIEAVRAVPRTLSGKRVEVPIKRILQGADPDTVLSRDTLREPDALDDFLSWREGG